MKLLILSTLLACTAAAPLGGNFNMNAKPGGMNADAQVRGFKAALYLFAPDSWVSSFNQISEEGQKCFLNAASNPASAQIYASDDIEAIKQDLASKCPTSANELNAFSDVTEQTVKTLPESFINIAKEWGKQMQTLGEQVKQSVAGAQQQAGANPLQQAGANVQQAAGNAPNQLPNGLQQAGGPNSQNVAALKQYMAQFAQSTATFTKQIGELSDADRQQISAAFPKMQPFFSGDHAVEFWNEVTKIYETLGAGGNVDWSSLKNQAKEFKDTLKAVFQQYKSANAEGLKQAGQLLNKDLTQADSVLDAQTSVQAGAVGSSGFAKFAQNHPEWSNKINDGIEKGKNMWNEGKQNAQENFNEFKQNTQENFNELKQNAQEQWGKLKEKANEWKNKADQEHSVDGAASINANGASANLNAN